MIESERSRSLKASCNKAPLLRIPRSRLRSQARLQAYSRDWTELISRTTYLKAFLPFSAQMPSRDRPRDAVPEEPIQALSAGLLAGVHDCVGILHAFQLISQFFTQSVMLAAFRADFFQT